MINVMKVIPKVKILDKREYFYKFQKFFDKDCNKNGIIFLGSCKAEDFFENDFKTLRESVFTVSIPKKSS